MWPLDIDLKGVLEHWCNGCCKDDDGNVTRSQQVENCYAALVEAGLFGSVEKTKPHKARWLSTSTVLSMLLTGMLFHQILPRTWLFVFPFVMAVPRGIDDFHLRLHSKIKRSSFWFGQERTVVSSALVCIISASLDHLLQVLQHEDTEGGVLRKICGVTTSPFHECQRSLSDLLQAPMRGPTEILFQHFGVDAVTRAELSQAIRGNVLRLGGLVWFFLQSVYEGFPYRLIMLVMRDIFSEDVIRNVVETFFALDECCLDKAFSLKVTIPIPFLFGRGRRGRASDGGWGREWAMGYGLWEVGGGGEGRSRPGWIAWALVVFGGAGAKDGHLCHQSLASHGVTARPLALE